MASFIPQVGVKGVWTLLTPFQSLLTPNIAYKCLAIRSLQDIIAGGGDPQTLYYTPNNLSSQVYQTDLANGVNILTLQNDSGITVYVPDSYLTTFPDIGGVPYNVVVLTINLGAIPESTDLTYLNSKISDAVQDNLGVSATIIPVVASATTIVSNDADATFQAARQTAIANNQTDNARYLAVNALLQSAVQQIEMLEAYIVSLNLPDTP
jgi:hypothetical protein